MGGCGKALVSKSPYRNSNQVRSCFRLPVNGRSALRAEVERQAIAAFGYAGVLSGISFDRDPITLETCLDAKNAPGAPLAFQAMANGNTHRFALAGETELPAIAGSVPNDHRTSRCFDAPPARWSLASGASTRAPRRAKASRRGSSSIPVT
jgi:hypothetical protein